jgi:phosphoglucosamine mutase
MSRKYFGTDGIRGRANGLITPELALKVGQAAGLVFQRGDHRHRVVIGKDTRLSGYMIEYAMVAGFTSVGMDVLLVGPMPTPAIAMLTKSMRADLGLAQSVRGQRHQAVRPAGLQAVRRRREADRAVAG